jgi:hypothetical protein
MEANQRQETTFVPRENDDTGLADTLKQVTDWARDYAEIDVEEAEAFENCLTCGIGWTYTFMDYEEDLDGKVMQESIPPFEMTYDMWAKKRNLRDARWVCRSKEMHKDEIIELWPEKEDELQLIEEVSYEDDDRQIIEKDDPTDRYTDEEEQEPQQRKNPRVRHFQWYERQPVYRVGMNNQIVELEQERFNKLKDELDIRGIKYIKQSKRIYYEAYVVNNVLLQKGKSPCQSGFNYKAVTGKRDHVFRQWYGLVRLMKDPQRWANKFFSSFLDIFASNSKGGVMIEEGAVSDMNKFEEEWAKPDSIVWLKEGAIAQGKVQEKPMAPYPATADRLMQYSVDSVYKVAGVNMDMMGMSERTEVGMVVESRKKSAYTVLAPFFDALGHYRKESGLTLLEYIRDYVPAQRMAEVVEDELVPYVEQIKQIDLRQVNVKVAESPSSDHNKMITWAFITQIVPQLLQLGISVPPEILEYSPLPAVLTEKWKKQIEEQKNNPQAAQQMQMQMQNMMLEMQKSGAEVSKTNAETQKISAEIQKIIRELGKVSADTTKSEAEAVESTARAEKDLASAEQARVETALGKDVFTRI